LPRKRIEYVVTTAELPCPDCGEVRKEIGESISEQYEYIPASVCVIEHARTKYACASCQGNVIIAEAPAKPIEKGLAGAGMLAYVATSKFGDHLPLNRLEGIFERQGAHIPRSTMCDWIAGTAAILLPLHNHMKNRVLASHVIFTDDTPVKLQDRHHENNIREARIWVYLGDEKNRFTVFDFTESRKRDGPKKFLDGFRGYLQADAFAGYDCLYTTGEVNECACMAHARRKFYECLGSDKTAAEQVLEMIRELYLIERDGASLTHDARRQLRLERSAPILHKMHVWLRTYRLTTLPKSSLGKAINYALNNWRALCRYLNHGELEIDNNRSERAIRPVAIGRKNWLFAGSREGGKNAAIIASFIATCKEHKLNPQRYLEDVITRLTAGADFDLDQSLPGNWVPAL
jgi:transposase